MADSDFVISSINNKKVNGITMRTGKKTMFSERIRGTKAREALAATIKWFDNGQKSGINNDGKLQEGEKIGVYKYFGKEITPEEIARKAIDKLEESRGLIEHISKGERSNEKNSRMFMARAAIDILKNILPVTKDSVVREKIVLALAYASSHPDDFIACYATDVVGNLGEKARPAVSTLIDILEFAGVIKSKNKSKNNNNKSHFPDESIGAIINALGKIIPSKEHQNEVEKEAVKSLKSLKKDPLFGLEANSALKKIAKKR